MGAAEVAERTGYARSTITKAQDRLSSSAGAASASGIGAPGGAVESAPPAGGDQP